ncbi:LOW QUALITY PROTEIN: pectinesterase B-like [Euwallacea similis]|uniref:LOW QUALITY PROTEIN: pectinesterase B-like n=1 Tax=Euwallacea similis TaxID=1736056 RepID=UPI00344F12B7
MHKITENPYHSIKHKYPTYKNEPYWFLLYIQEGYSETASRPILSEEEAQKYAMENHFAGWESQDMLSDTPDYVVKDGESIQVVGNEATAKESKHSRVYIQIEPGHYIKTVGDVPLIIYGLFENPEEINIMSILSALAAVEDGRARKWQAKCSIVCWIQSSDIELKLSFGVNVHKGAPDTQAVAIKVDADKVRLINDQFLNMQDIVGLDIKNNQLAERVMVHMRYIEEETDYVYGSVVAIIEMTTFNTIITVQKGHRMILAPDTALGQSYGFLVMDSNITTDASYEGFNRIKLARVWDRSVQSADDYVPDISPNGQLIIRDSNINNMIDVEAPCYVSAATSGRKFGIDIKEGRNLNDKTHNRLWKFNNYGTGTQNVFGLLKLRS